MRPYSFTAICLLTFLALGAPGCAAGAGPSRAPRAEPAASAPASSPVRPEPRTIVEKAKEVPFIEGFLGDAKPSAAVYLDDAKSPTPILPFQFGYQESTFHLIAYFDGHPNLEAVECMVSPDPSSPHGQRLFAITTDHENRQEYYVPDHEVEIARTVTIPVHRSAIVCEVEPDWRKAHLEFLTAQGERVVLKFLADAPPDPRWSMIPDPGGHNPTGGLVAMYVQAASIAVPPSGVTIGAQGYPLVPDEASQPPYFVGLRSYLTRGFAYSYLNTYEPVALVASSPSDDLPGFEAPSGLSRVEANLVSGAADIQEVASLQARQATGNQDNSAQIRFNPPFPNLRALRPSTEVRLRFAWTMTLVEKPVVLGNLVITRQNDEVRLQFLPEYPGWAQQGRRMTCLVDLSQKPATTRCDAMLTP